MNAQAPTTLSGEELVALVQRVFQPTDADRALAIIIDLPDSTTPDRPAWKQRRAMALEWVRALRAMHAQTGLQVHLVAYPNVHMNNADLPDGAWVMSEAVVDETAPCPQSAEQLEPLERVPFADVLRQHSLVIAPTQFSATAPLKLMAPTHGFRAATMPGFTAEMVPALRLDYQQIHHRVHVLKTLLDQAVQARFTFEVDEQQTYELTLDLRHRQAHASGGLLPKPGTAGNLPSGEAYIVPYEGEREGDPSQSSGQLPVQLGQSVVVYRIEQNVAVEVQGDGEVATFEKEHLAQEPAYGNIAELGLGVLADFGVQPAGEILLDEKLGLHIAFGRSDHFGGRVGAAQFSRPEQVVHIDRVYLPSVQPRVLVRQVDLVQPDGSVMPLLRDGRYVVDFGAPADR